MANFGNTVKSVKRAEKEANEYLISLAKWSKMWRLKFAPHKCSYTVFAKSKKAATVKINLKLYNVAINEEKNPKFLGLTYDKLLSGKKHLESIKKKCNSRLSIIRILGHRSWGLKKETLVQIYKSLIRSVIEYVGLSYSAFSRDQRQELEVIQNSALRAIFKKKREFGNKNLLKLAKIESVKARMDKLNNEYLLKSLKNKNPLIMDMVQNYKDSLKAMKGKGYIAGATILSLNKQFKKLAKKENLL